MCSNLGWHLFVLRAQIISPYDFVAFMVSVEKSHCYSNGVGFVYKLSIFS